MSNKYKIETLSFAYKVIEGIEGMTNKWNH